MRSRMDSASRRTGTFVSDREHGSTIVASAEREPAGAAQSAAVAGRRSGIFSNILLDAARGAREYVERWVAGRGAE
jgi:hypothetical protein